MTDEIRTLTSSATTSVELEIFGTVLTVRSGSSEEHLRQLADHVDRTMKQIAASTTTVDTTKVALLAALNIADQLRSVDPDADAHETRKVEERIEALSERLEKVLQP